MKTKLCHTCLRCVVLRSLLAMMPVRNGDIGDNPREVEYEPLTAPSVPEPVTAPVPEPVPA